LQKGHEDVAEAVDIEGLLEVAANPVLSEKVSKGDTRTR